MKKWPMVPTEIVITPVFALPVLDPDNEGPIIVGSEPLTLVARLEPISEPTSVDFAALTEDVAIRLEAIEEPGT